MRRKLPQDWTDRMVGPKGGAKRENEAQREEIPEEEEEGTPWDAELDEVEGEGGEAEGKARKDAEQGEEEGLEAAGCRAPATRQKFADRPALLPARRTAPQHNLAVRRREQGALQLAVVVPNPTSRPGAADGTR